MNPAMLPLLDAPIAGTAPGWHLHLEAIAPLVVIEALYLWAIVRMHERSPQTRPLSESSVMLFTTGILVIYLAVGTPIDDLADHYLLSAHMLQHMLLSMVAPAFLLMGLPGWLLRPLLVRPSVFPIAFVVTQPFVAFALFNLTLVFVHLPAAMSTELGNEYTVHLAAHMLLISTGMLMWWPGNTLGRVYGDLLQVVQQRRAR